MLGLDRKWAKYDAHSVWMRCNYTTNLQNIREGRWWTMATACVSHSDFLHFASNMLGLWLFGFKTYRILNVDNPLRCRPGFLGLYLCGGLAASLAHVTSNYVNGRNEAPITPGEERDLKNQLRRIVQEKAGDRVAKGLPLTRIVLHERDLPSATRHRFRFQDIPSLGASGSIMAISCASACLFPGDRIVFRSFLVPLPIAVGMYIMSELAAVALTGANANVDHAGHLAGATAGVLYIAFVWRKARGGVFSYCPREPLPIITYLRSNSITKQKKI